MSLHIKPVAGKSPAEVAKELRVLIRDSLYRPISKGGATTPKTKSSSSYSTYIDTNHAKSMSALQEIHDELITLYDVCKLRRPSDVRKAIKSIRPKLDQIRAYAAANQTYKNTIVQNAGAPAVPFYAELLPAVERAYALVQALPTVEEATNGREANTLRAMTAILKVYYGIDVDSEPTDLVDALMKQIAKTREEDKGPQVWTPFVMHGIGNSAEIEYDIGVDWHSLYPYAMVRPKMPLPWQIWTTKGKAASLVFDDKPDIGYGWGETGNIEHWNGGDCSFGDAFQALAYVRSRWSDSIFRLVDATGIWWVSAEPSTDPVVHYIPEPGLEAGKSKEAQFPNYMVTSDVNSTTVSATTEVF